jgi:hypothetical protein
MKKCKCPLSLNCDFIRKDYQCIEAVFKLVEEKFTSTSSAMVPCLAYKERFRICDHAVVFCNDISNTCEHKAQHQ